MEKIQKDTKKWQNVENFLQNSISHKTRLKFRARGKKSKCLAILQVRM